MSKFKTAMNDAKGVFKKGNILLLAIGLLIGTVFGALVKSVADDLIMAPIAKFLKFNSLADMVYGGVRVGNFLAALLTFIIVALFLFVLLVGYFLIANAVKARKEAKNPKPAPEAPKPTTEELILAELQKLNDNIKK